MMRLYFLQNLELDNSKLENVTGSRSPNIRCLQILNKMKINQKKKNIKRYFLIID